MNPFEMVAIIVVAVMVASVLRAKYGHSRRQDDVRPARAGRGHPPAREVKQLKERIHVLERIATDRENSLAREIDDLRDR